TLTSSRILAQSRVSQPRNRCNNLIDALGVPICFDHRKFRASLESDQALQDAVLTMHHAYMVTLAGTAAFKIIENQKGVAFVQSAQQVAVARA
ncbi:MAG: hypothetical protein M3R31_07460, partial [Pseudomonadota bacterium]|nr:hypothetical protein [Pseudomonadota bacterium]